MKVLKRSMGILLGLFLCANAAFAGITKVPYLIYENTNTAMTVLWQDSATETNVIKWGTDTNYTMGSANVAEYGSSHQHKYAITGLTPSTKYYYQVSATAGGTVYGTGSFVAAPAASATAVKFLAFGDTRSNPASMEQVINRMRAEYATDPAFQSLTLQVGDWVSSDAESAWTSEWFNANPQTRALLAETPINGVKGNHEGTGTYYAKYYPYPYTAGAYWSFDYGPLHVSVVDQYTGGGYTSGTAQYNWLVNDLATTTKPWKIILIHEPGWAAGTHANNTTVQNVIQPLVLQYGVDMVLTGHNHNYVRAMVNNIPHITDGGGGAPLYAVDMGQPNVVAGYSGLSYCSFDINGNTMTMKAKKTDGTVVDTITVTHGASVPAAPTGLTATAGNAQVNLSWTASSGATSYNVKRSTVSGGPYTTVAAGVTSTNVTNTGLTNGTTYYYVVTAVNANGESGNSNQASATPTAPAPPVAPTGLAATAGNGQVSLSWTASSGATSYSVKRATVSGGPYTTVATGVTAVTYVNTGLTNGTTYYYVVSAVNANGESGNSNQASATPSASTPVTVNSQVNTSNDDVEERQTGGTMYNNSSDLELVYDSSTTGNQYVGMRFTNVNVPKGKTITNAYIQFTVDETGSTATSLTIKGQAADNAATFTTAAYNVSSRAKTTASVAWSPVAWNTVDAAGADQRTPDLKTIVQEIVNRTGWAQNNAMAFIVTGTGKRTARAYDVSATKAPKLVITYQ